MTIPLGPLRLSISLTLVEDSGPCWEELAAVGMEDLELARLNVRNTLHLEVLRCEYLHPFIGGTRRP